MAVAIHATDPPVRADGRCAAPGCNKRRDPERSRRYGDAAAQLDPFCSTECCRRWHGNPLPAKSIWSLEP